MPRDGRLIGLFGETRRYPVEIEKVPASRSRTPSSPIEDARFYEHGGVDYKGVARADLAAGDHRRASGWPAAPPSPSRSPSSSSSAPNTASSRKFAEMLLAMKMERELSKDEIFELYLNKSFFGNRAYGVGAAAEFYYGKTAGAAQPGRNGLAGGDPQVPVQRQPAEQSRRAPRIRRDYVLQRMRELNMISAVAEEQAAQCGSDARQPA
jgi:penicillin-binding protein 1A